MTHKIELTQFQADKIKQAVKEKFHATHDATWLGLMHNLDFQTKPKTKVKNIKTQIVLL